MRVLAAFVLMMTSAIGATTLVYTDLPEMSREARTIALGRVVAIESRWTADRRRIETTVVLEAESYLKGMDGSRVQFVVPGGQVGELRHLVVGAPRFQLGERVVVFLGARTPGIPFVLGFNQGVFRVTLENGDWIVTSQTAVSRRALAGSRGWQPRRSIQLADFAREVRALAAER